jgi:citrate synthase
MSNQAKLELDGKTYTLPVVVGTEDEKAVDVSALRANTGYITLDEGYGNTGACQSKVTFIDGEKGILRYRGIPIEELAEKSSFVETAFLVIYGHLPSHSELQRFSDLLAVNQNLHEDMKYHFEGFPSGSHPMAILSAMINAASCFYPDLMHGGRGFLTASPWVGPSFIQKADTSTRRISCTCCFQIRMTITTLNPKWCGRWT